MLSLSFVDILFPLYSILFPHTRTQHHGSLVERESIVCVFVEEREDRFRLWKESKTRAYIIRMKSVKEGYYDDRAKVCC